MVVNSKVRASKELCNLCPYIKYNPIGIVINISKSFIHVKFGEKYFAVSKIYLINSHFIKL